VTGKLSINDRDVQECLDLVRRSIGEVIDIGTVGENHDRPAWAMDVLQHLRGVENTLETALAAEAAESEAAQ
jgi:hypothetical protein